MAFATVDDVETRLGRDLTEREEDAATAVIETVEGLIVEVSGNTAPSPAPAYYKALCVEKAIDAITRPERAVAAKSLGAFSVTYTRQSDDLGVFLSEYEEAMVRRIANNATSGSSHLRALPHDVYVTEVDDVA